MFERYTEKARRVIFFARYEASQFGSPYIESEHLLLGILREDKALANRFLRNDASVESIRRQIEARTPIGEKISTSVDLPLADSCQRVLAYAAEEAERLAHKHIGTEHLLLGLLREQPSFAAELLAERGLEINQVRAALHITGHDLGQRHASAPPAPIPAPAPVIPVRFVDVRSAEPLFEYESRSSSHRLPAIGETVAFLESSDPNAPGRVFRVEDITWVCRLRKAPPADVVEVHGRIEFIVHRMENAIANHEFEKARFYSEEERKERENLRALEEKHQADEPPGDSGKQRTTAQLQEIVIAIASANKGED